MSPRLRILQTLLLLTPPVRSFLFFFFFNDTATTEIYTLSLHDALPIYERAIREDVKTQAAEMLEAAGCTNVETRSEEHTSELQSLAYLVCRLLLEKKKKKNRITDSDYAIITPNASPQCM